VEQNARRAIDAGLAEDNNWADSEQRVQFVYQFWVSSGRPPASVIKHMGTEATQGSLPAVPSRDIAIDSSRFLSPKGHAGLQTSELASKPLPAPSSESLSPSHPRPRPTPRYAQPTSHLIQPLNLQGAHDGLINDEDTSHSDEEHNEDQDLANIDKEILLVENEVATLKGMMSNKSKQSDAALHRLIKAKESELGEARKRRATLSTAPRVQRHLPFIGDRRARGMEVIQAARKMIHDFAVSENVDPTAMQRLLHASLTTSAKSSAWDAFENLQSIVRNGGGE
jgi:hypothetical protein